MKDDLPLSPRHRCYIYVYIQMDLMDSVRRGDVEEVERIAKTGVYLDMPVHMGVTPLMVASRQGKTAIVRILLENGADPDIRDGYGQGPLMYGLDDPAVVKLVLDGKANPNLKDSNGSTALIYAVSNNDLVTVRLLLDHGANTDLMDRHGATPLELALVHGNEDMFNLLLDSGANPNTPNSDGGTPLMSAVMYDKKVKFIPSLLSHGADPNIASKSGKVPLEYALEYGRMEVARLLLDHRANPNVKRRYLARMTRRSEGDIVRLLLEYGADPDSTSREGSTLLMVNSDGGDIDMVRLLLEKGANANMVDEEGVSPLMKAVTIGDMDMIALLLDYGADPSLRDWDGRTAVSVARRDDIKNLINTRARSMKDVKARSRSYMDDSYHDLNISFRS